MKNSIKFIKGQIKLGFNAEIYHSERGAPTSRYRRYLVLFIHKNHFVEDFHIRFDCTSKKVFKKLKALSRNPDKNEAK